MIPRRALKTVQDALNRQAAVALLGPRQVGKTTLAHTVAEQTGTLYLDLEAREDREKLSDPALFLRVYEDRLVILDEIHRVPELFQALRGLIDQGRRESAGRSRSNVVSRRSRGRASTSHARICSLPAASSCTPEKCASPSAPTSKPSGCAQWPKLCPLREQTSVALYARDRPAKVGPVDRDGPCRPITLAVSTKCSNNSGRWQPESAETTARFGSTTARFESATARFASATSPSRSRTSRRSETTSARSGTFSSRSRTTSARSEPSA